MVKLIWRLLLLICATSIPAWGQVPEAVTHNVVVVLDASGSMGNSMHGASMTKMDVAKKALIQVMRKVQPDTHVGLLVFSSANLSDDWAYPLGPLDPEKLKAAVQRPLPGGKTPLGRYIKKGADRLLAKRTEQFGYGTYRLLIVTDGEADDQQQVDHYVPEVMTRGIVMDVIGVDMSSRHTLSTKVHTYRRADDPEALTRALIEVFAEVGGDRDTDAAGEEAFDQIAPIPMEMAQAMLKALSSIDNTPIGQGMTASPAAKPPQHPAPQPPSTVAPPAPPPGADGPGFPWSTTALVVLILGIAFSRSRRKKR